MNYHNNLIRIKYLESLSELSETKVLELKLRKILHENINKMQSSAKLGKINEEIEYLMYHSEIVIHMLKKHEY